MEETTACSQLAAPARQFSRVLEILARYEYRPSRLVPILQAVQEEYRYLPEDVMTVVATGLGIPPSTVFGVATFYSFFTLKPRGKYTIRLCDGTACHVKNSMPILEALRGRLGLSDRVDTTSDMLFTLETVSCLGACGLAPVMVVNDEVYGQVTPEKALKIVDDVLAEEGAK